MKQKTQTILIITLLFIISTSGCLTQEPPSFPPHVNLKLTPTTAKTLTTITLQADIFDDGTKPCNISWDLGDGSTLYEKESFEHMYKLPGTYRISLKVTDEHNQTAQVNTTITITNNIAPTIQIQANNTLTRPNHTIQFTAIANDYDGAIQHHFWNFGDNTTSEDQITTHSYPKPGTYLVTHTVTDDQGATTNQTLTLYILENQPPKIHNITSDKESILLGPARASFNASCSDTDGTIISYEWNFDETFPYNLWKQETTGQNISHLFLQAKTYHITLTITDNEGATDTFYLPFAIQFTPLSLFTSIKGLYNLAASFLPLPSLPTG